jgi:hypothetical protein
MGRQKKHPLSYRHVKESISPNTKMTNNELQWQMNALVTIEKRRK